MITVAELVPGDCVASLGMRAVFIAQTPHPIYHGLRLVIWRLSDNIVSFDALDLHQEVGTIVEPNTHEARQDRLLDVFSKLYNA